MATKKKKNLPLLARAGKQQILIWVLAPVLLLGVVFTLTASATAPFNIYDMQGSCSHHWCQEKISIYSNPSNYNIRAYAVCNNAGTYYGGWHQAQGDNSYAKCPSGYYVEGAGFQYDKTHQYGVRCFSLGGNKSGFC